MGQAASDEALQDVVDRFGGSKSIPWTGFLEVVLFNDNLKTMESNAFCVRVVLPFHMLQLMTRLYYWKKVMFEREFYLPALKFPEFSRSDIREFIDGPFAPLSVSLI